MPVPVAVAVIIRVIIVMRFDRDFHPHHRSDHGGHEEHRDDDDEHGPGPGGGVGGDNRAVTGQRGFVRVGLAGRVRRWRVIRVRWRMFLRAD
jgi:hypothetical protein